MERVIAMLEHGPMTRRDLLAGGCTDSAVEMLFAARVITMLMVYEDPLDCVFGVYAN